MPRLRPYKVKKKLKATNELKEKRKTWELIESLLEAQLEIKMEERGEPFSKSIWSKTN